MNFFSCELVYVLNDVSTTPLYQLGCEIALSIKEHTLSKFPRNFSMEKISLAPWACFSTKSCNTLAFSSCSSGHRARREMEDCGVGARLHPQPMGARHAFESRRFRRSNPRPMPPAENQSKWRIAGWVRSPEYRKK